MIYWDRKGSRGLERHTNTLQCPTAWHKMPYKRRGGRKNNLKRIIDGNFQVSRYRVEIKLIRINGKNNNQNPNKKKC